MSKNGRFRSFSRLWGVVWRGKTFRDQQCQFLTRNKSLSSENESNCSMTSECVRTDLIFSLSNFGILVERLSFWRLHFLLRLCYGFFFFFLLSSSMQGLKYVVTDFKFRPAKKVMLRQSRLGRVKLRFWRFFVYISISRAKLKIL